MPGQAFDYDDTTATALVSAISPQRFSTYLDRTGTAARGLQLYAWNTAAAASLYAPLQTIEVTLRNAVHDAMSQSYGDRWFDNPALLRAAEQKMVAQATAKLNDLAKPVTPGRVVAELSYGFWVALFANKYDATLWRTDLFRLFAPQIKQRPLVHESLDRLRTLRNRIAHHEPIFQRKLTDDLARIRALLGCLSKDTLNWLDHQSSAADVLVTTPDRITRF